MEHRSEYGEGGGMGEGSRPGDAARRGDAGRYDRTGEAGRTVRQARERLSDAYGRTAETAERVYDRAIDFGRENPGTATLLALGAGIAVGLWLGGGERSYRDRIVPTLATRVAEAMLDIFDGGR
jgi:hypothetical protein